jgi:pimeloyl-ACP methyl ester carboxylesterase
MSDQPRLEHVRTATLDIACELSGPDDGAPVILLHGFPDDPRTWDRAVAHLARAGYRTIAPYLRGYGPTHFLDAKTLRSGEQAALGHDLLGLMDALRIRRATLVGYDWGGRAACVVAALWPERARALVSIGGYNILNVAANAKPMPPAQEHRMWYQWYFATERGRAGLAANRRDFCKLLWRLWSPNWRFDDATYDRTAASFDNPDFVEVVIHSYRHRFGWVPGDPSLIAIEERLNAMPQIGVPTIVLHGDADGVAPVQGSQRHARFFGGRYVRRVISGAGHFLAWEAPDAIVAAVRELIPDPAMRD